METFLIILGVFVGLLTNAIAYSCFRKILLTAEVNLEDRLSKKCLSDRASFESLKLEIKTHLDKVTKEVKILQREVDKLKN